MSYVHTQPTPVERTRRRGLGGVTQQRAVFSSGFSLSD